jgi:hypothetical protein
MTGMNIGADVPSARTNLIFGCNTKAPEQCSQTRLNHADLAICTSAMPLLCLMSFFAHGVTFEYGGLHQTRPLQSVVNPSSIMVNDRFAGIHGTPFGGADTSMSNSSFRASNMNGGV